MKVYRIEYDRRVMESINLPFEKIKEVETYDGNVKLIDHDDLTVLVVPLRDLTYCAVVDIPDPQPPAPPVEPPTAE